MWRWVIRLFVLSLAFAAVQALAASDVTSGAASAGATEPSTELSTGPAIRKAGEVLTHTLKGYVRPAYRDLAARFGRLEAASVELCDRPSEAALETARDAFGQAVIAWAGIEWFRTGPAMVENRLERILFYPDRKSTGLRQVQRALSAKEDALTSPDILAEQSVAMQGFGAYEYLVFGEGSQDLSAGANPFRCRYAASVASNLNRIGGKLAEGWQPGRPLADVFVKPAADNLLFRDDTEALNLLLATMVHGLEAIRDIRIGAFLKEPGTDRPNSAIYRRAGLTMPSIAAGLEGLEALFNESGIEKVLDDENRALADQVRFEFAQAIGTAQSFDAGPETLLADTKARQKLVYLQLAITYIIERLNDEIAPAAGLAAGFSFGDGD